MSNLKICRICLSKDVKMYKYDTFRLKYFYEQMMCIYLNEKDDLPKYFCYLCAALLHKFHKFKEKCVNGQRILKEMVWNGPITYECINKLDKQNLQSTLDFIIESNSIRTCIVKYKSMKIKPQAMIEQIDVRNELPIEKEETNDIELESVFDDGFNNSSDDEPLIKEKLKIEEIAIEPKKEQPIAIEEIFTDFIEKEKERICLIEDKAVENKIEDITEVVKDDIVLFEEKNISVPKDKRRRKRKSKNKDLDLSPNKFKTEQRREKFLDSNNWQKFTLTEEEAEIEFKARAEDSKYLKANFKCTDCLKGFSTEDMLNRHVKLRHDESVGPIACRFCRMRFKWVCFLRRHMREHYNKYKCLRCDLVCPLETTAIFHEEYHNGVLRKCEHCGEEYRHMSTYYTHLRTHRSEFVCVACGASFVSAAGLHRHRLMKHPLRGKEPPKEKGDESTHCGRCDISFESKKAYEEHLIHSALHVEGVQDLAAEAPAPSNPKRRRKYFKKDYRKPTTCNKCGLHFRTQQEFVRHHLAAHPRMPLLLPNERHICEICGVSLAPVSVANHLNTHTREQRHSCPTCGLQLSSRGSLTRHQLTHTDEKKVSCPLCDKKFKQNCSMKLHYRTYHLKEPYPKRNRRKKSKDSNLLEYRNEDQSDDEITLDKWR
ncbi:hypothetical protein K1T71_013185 [Dendrolimus kikuchii]|uniref:Uncharacterized protein n=1 Tax=Dendrolimus kikuchii TaxID=765133 RepID=A0ACC1CJ70_9NEOP|nr:hypothetical protein K1T71_013185 [Dendrolimus kikuchii]